MLISDEAISKILGIGEKVPLTSLEMADKMNITFFPFDEKVQSKNVIDFYNKLKVAFMELKVNVVPFESALINIPIYKSILKSIQVILGNILIFYKNIVHKDKKLPFIELSVIPNLILKRKRIKPGISVISLGTNDTGKLPMDQTLSFRDSTVITIVDRPETIKNNSDFHTHFNTAMDLFAFHMTNIVIAVSGEDFIVYNFNASHPIYPLNDGKFNEHLLDSLVPKVVAPIRPHRFKDFIVSQNHFDLNDPNISKIVEEFMEGGKLFSKTNLYPNGKKLDDLPFRTKFYRWIGKIHLDNRNGMSYGFLAWQMPATYSELIPIQEAKKIYKIDNIDNDCISIDDKLYLCIEVNNSEYLMKVPDIYVMSQRSGSNKTNINPSKDLIKMGLSNGKMFLETPKGLVLDSDYKPSFDTKVILAHALGNAIIGSIFRFLKIENEFTSNLEKTGLAIAHWHGYINPKNIPDGFNVHGIENPHVACSSPQSAIYALRGKLHLLETTQNLKTYRGDIHIEPHHGTNIIFPSIKSLAEYFLSRDDISILGNKYLEMYKM
jgi:hypothetical protein